MTVAVYGASGCIGRQVVRELGRMQTDVVLGGRNPNNLERAAHETASPAAAVRVADPNDPAELRAMLRGQRVLVNCAPTAACGEALVDAALEAGAHYIDAGADQSFIRKVFEHHDVVARQRGVVLVPGAGFDYAPGDCLARLAAARLDPLAEVVVAYDLDGPAATRRRARAGTGTGASAPQTDDAGEVIYQDGTWRPPPLGVWRASFTFPDPLGRRSMTRYGSGEVITVPRHTRTRRVVSMITANSLAPHPALDGLVPYLRPAASMARRTPLARVLSARPETPRRSPAPTTTPETMRFVIVAVARTEDGTVSQGMAYGSVDPDALTAAALAHGATRMAGEEFVGAGTHSPAATFDPAELLDALTPRGLQWELHRPPRAWDLHPLW